MTSESTAYELIQRLGGGSFGVVHLAKTSTGTRFAIKTLEPSPSVQHAIGQGLLTYEELLKRFSKEVRYQRRVDHPNVVKILDFNINHTPPFFVMELAECTMKDELDKDRTLGGAPQGALFDILAGLEAIHAAGIFHRDLKPANVLKFRDPAGNIRYALSDFGLMSAPGADTTTLTATGVGGGTEYYAAPELITNLKRATAASDIYSFGVILHDIFGGGARRIPYTEVHLAGGLGQIALRCTKKNPLRRYQRISEIRAELYALLSTEPIVFASGAEKEIIALLESKAELSEEEWDRVFMLIEENQERPRENHNIFRAVTAAHLYHLKLNAPDLLSAFSIDFCEYIHDREGALDFSYCDVVADKLGTLFELGDTAIKASALLALMVLGASHNRWVVERRFIDLAGQDLPDAVAHKFVADAEILGIDLPRHISHIEWSISTSRAALHTAIQAGL